MLIRSVFARLRVLISTLGAADAGKRFSSVGSRPPLRHRARTTEGPANLPAGLNVVEWVQIRTEFERHRHGMFADGAGGYQSRSHGQGWLVRFDGNGFEVKPDKEPWTWGLQLERWGRPEQEVAVGGPAWMEKEWNRLEYRRRGLTEWFVNGREGLEHGFTIRQRPQGAGGDLCLHLRVRGDLVAELDPSGEWVSFLTAQGDSALQYRKLVVTDARGRRLASRMLVEGTAIRILVDDRTAAYPLTVDPTVQRACLEESKTRGWEDWAGQLFGDTVAISDGTVVVGASRESSNATGVNGDQSDNSAPDSGAVYVFVRRGSDWTQEAYLKASQARANDLFGTAVTISGDTLVIGAPGEASRASGGIGDGFVEAAPDAGAAYVFVRKDGIWSQQACLKASNAGAGDLFGRSVAISGDTVIVTAPSESSSAAGVNGNQGDNSATGAGAAYVFVRKEGNWSQQAYLKASNTGAGDGFGISAAISGDTVVVGAYCEGSSSTGVNGIQHDNSATYSGAAYVFVRDAGTWRQQAYLKASNTAAGHVFGLSVAVSGDTVVVGAYREDGSATGVNGAQRHYAVPTAGAAYVFVRNAGVWSQQAYLKASNSEESYGFGWRVAISADTVVVGAFGEGGRKSAAYSGAAYVFGRQAGSWSQQAYLNASPAEALDSFGWSVAIFGDTVVMGAIPDSSHPAGEDCSHYVHAPFAPGVSYAFAK